MNVYITKLNGCFMSDVAQFVQRQTAEIAHQIGCREMGIFRYGADTEDNASRSARLDGIIAGIQAGDVVIYQYPTWNGTYFERELVQRIKTYGGHVVIFVHDFEALMNEEWRHKFQETIDLYNQAEVLIVASYALRDYMLENGVRKDMKFVIQEIWDYPTDICFMDKPILKKEIHFAGHAGKFTFVNGWNYEVPLAVYSSVSCSGENMRNMGWMNPSALLLELSKGGFGLVWYGDEYWQQYMKYNNSTKISLYLAAGIPVIVPCGISNQYLIEENHLGIAVDSLEEAVEKVRDMTEEEYSEYVAHVGKFAPLLRQGYFAKRLLTEAVHLVFREDAVREQLPVKTYDLGGASFDSSALRESYGGNLALSWDFKGTADGFLVYDEAGNLVEETENIYQHYLLIKHHKREDGFRIKAYVNTLKGKLVVAETGLIYLKESLYQTPVVSLVMPAYNAEEYIARSIDTALAQSFPDLEIIIVNDGSTDGTQSIIDWYGERYPHVVVIHQENGGVPVARNIGIKCARGEYIAFMDNDDMLRPNMLKRLYDSIKKNNCDIAITSIYRIVNDRYNISMQYPFKEDTAISMEELPSMYVIGHAIVVLWNKLYRASLVKDHLIPQIIFDDEAWTPYILSYADNVCYIDGALYEYDRSIRNGTLQDKWFQKSKDEIFAWHKGAILFYMENGNPKRKKLLKEFAKNELKSFLGETGYVEYGMLWDEIDEAF